MRKILLFLPLLALFACTKDSTGGSGRLLREIRTPSGLDEVFEYQNGKLVKESNYYAVCTTTPVDEYVYTYQNNKLVKLETTTRGIYSSTAALCNPALGERTREEYEYDSRGRLAKSTIFNSSSTMASYSIYEYNANDLVVKRLLYLPNGTLRYTATFKYDSRGNIIEEHDFQGNTIQYSYDNKINPFHTMQKMPGWISPFTTSPNNVLTGVGGFGNFERKIIKYERNQPSEVQENGVEYTYIYQ